GFPPGPRFLVFGSRGWGILRRSFLVHVPLGEAAALAYIAFSTIPGDTMAALPSTSPAQSLGDLPSWNLEDLYPGPDSAELLGDLEHATREAMSFRAAHEGKIATLPG